MQWKFRLAFAIAAVALLFVLALARGAYVSEQFFWREVAASSKFAPRDSASAFTFDDWLYLSNGYGSDGRPLRDLWRSRDGREWDIVSDATPYTAYAPILSVGSRLVAPLYDCWVSDDAERWEKIATDLPFGRKVLGSVAGFKDGLIAQDIDQMWASKSGCDWRPLGSPLFGQRYGGSLIEFRGRLLYVGGAMVVEHSGEHYSGLAGRSEVLASDDGANWQVLTDAPGWKPRMWPAVASDGQRLWMFGGYDNGGNANLGGLWVSEDGAHWRRAMVGTTRPSKRHAASMFSTKEGLLVAAGNQWPLVNDVWLYRLPTLGDFDQFLAELETDTRLGAGTLMADAVTLKNAVLGWLR